MSDWFSVRAMSRRAYFFAVFVAMVVLAGCDSPVGGTSATPTPLPTPPNTVSAICDSAERPLARLSRRLQADPTADTLEEQGAAVAQMTGIFTSDAERLRGVLGEMSPAEERWVSSIEAAAEAGVRAVRASASKDLDAFLAARSEIDSRRQEVRAAAVESGTESCPY